MEPSLIKSAESNYHFHPYQIHAEQTELYLVNERLTEVRSIVKAAKMIANELNPDPRPQDASPEYRKSLAQGLFFKVHYCVVLTVSHP